MRLTFSVLVALLLCVAAASGATILDVTGPSPFGFANQGAFATGWHQTGTYTNVTITMPLEDNTNGGPISSVEGVAYLVNQVGPGTTSANEVTSPFSIFGLTASFTTRTLFSGLTLGPGDYFVVVAATNNDPMSASPEGSSLPVATLGIGVTQLNGGSPLGDVVASYAPASNFSGSKGPSNIFVTVTGDAGAAAVPEPAVISLAAAGIGGLLLWKRRSRRSNY